MQDYMKIINENKAEMLLLRAGKRSSTGFEILKDKRIPAQIAWDMLRKSGHSEEEMASFWAARGDFHSIKRPSPKRENQQEKRPDLMPGKKPEDYDPRLRWKSCCD